jgi:hypothetical protein
MFKSAAEEIDEWADRCRRWARLAQSKEQRQVLQSWERIFNQAQAESDESVDYGYGSKSHLQHKL